MGEAKRRGTYEERKATAIERDTVARKARKEADLNERRRIKTAAIMKKPDNALAMQILAEVLIRRGRIGI